MIDQERNDRVFRVMREHMGDDADDIAKARVADDLEKAGIGRPTEVEFVPWPNAECPKSYDLVVRYAGAEYRMTDEFARNAI